jgi:hypothetical protein
VTTRTGPRQGRRLGPAAAQPNRPADRLGRLTSAWWHGVELPISDRVVLLEAQMGQRVSTGEVASVSTPAGNLAVGEVAVDHRHTHRTLARGGGHALHTVGPHVASGEDAWNAGLEREW